MYTIIRHFASSPRILNAYTQKLGKQENDWCSFLQQIIQLSLRDEQTTTPDHAHRQRIEYYFFENKSLATKLLLSLTGFQKACDTNDTNYTKSVLYINGNHVYIRQEFIETWQKDFLSAQNPVPLIAGAWEAYGSQNKMPLPEILKGVINSLRYSSLPGIDDNRLHNLIRNDESLRGQLCDLHIHFNGSTEYSFIWLHSLTNIDTTVQYLSNAHKKGGPKGKVPLFYEQLEMMPMDFLYQLRKAANIRKYICKKLNHWIQGHTYSTPSEEDSFIELIREKRPKGIYNINHPFRSCYPSSKLTDLQIEGIMWVYIIWALRQKTDFGFACLVHVYMLLSNQYIRLLVQQIDQFGFDQFQYLTLLDARENIEGSNFYSRFSQFHGMYGPDMAHVEVRFSPKNEPKKNLELLKKMWEGYQSLHPKNHGIIPCRACPKIAEQYRLSNGKIKEINPTKQIPPMNLGIVAHFIKTKEKEPYLSHRFQTYRQEIDKKARAFLMARQILYCTNYPLYQALVGKDAAANELETPPEVFAPVFRRLYRAGVTNTTYHAGEDFDHIISGIRSVHEAITFLDLSCGDRIGHATALGILPKHCKSFPCFSSQGAWLDNLVWLTRLIEKTDTLGNYKSFIPVFLIKIEELCRNIFEKTYPLSILWKAWELRKLDISLLNQCENSDYLYFLPKHEHIETQMLKHAIENHKEAVELWKKYHDKKYRDIWDKKIPIDSNCFDDDFIYAVQDAIVLEMRQKNIVIESPPTSNVRISHYNATDDHHILRWLDRNNSRPSPFVVLGTDNPGIFSTNMRNEYSLILNMLHKMYPSQSETPYVIINALIKNANSYKFMLKETRKH